MEPSIQFLRHHVGKRPVHGVAFGSVLELEEVGLALILDDEDLPFLRLLCKRRQNFTRNTRSVWMFVRRIDLDHALMADRIVEHILKERLPDPVALNAGDGKLCIRHQVEQRVKRHGRASSGLDILLDLGATTAPLFHAALLVHMRFGVAINLHVTLKGKALERGVERLRLTERIAVLLRQQASTDPFVEHIVYEIIVGLGNLLEFGCQSANCELVEYHLSIGVGHTRAVKHIAIAAAN